MKSRLLRQAAALACFAGVLTTGCSASTKVEQGQAAVQIAHLVSQVDSCAQPPPVTWRGQVYLHGTSSAGAETFTVSSDLTMTLHNMQTFSNMITSMSRCSIRMELAVHTTDDVWTDTPYSPTPEYDFVLHSYPRTALDKGYEGMASPEWIKLPVTPERPNPRALVMVHEFLHVLTWHVQETDVEVALPEGAVHAPQHDASLSQLRDETFYALYLQGGVEQAGLWRGIPPNIVIAAGTPTRVVFETELNPQLLLDVERKHGLTPAGAAVEEVVWQAHAASSSALKVEVRTASGVVRASPVPASVGKSGAVQTSSGVTVCAWVAADQYHLAGKQCRTA